MANQNTFSSSINKTDLCIAIVILILYKAINESIVDKQNEGFIIHSDLIETFNN